MLSLRHIMETFIERGHLRKTAGQAQDAFYELRYLEEKDLPLLLSLQEAVALALPSPEIFRLDKPAYFRKHFEKSKSVIGAFSDGRLIAYGIISFPPPGEEHFGADIGLPPEELPKAAHLETSAVHPDYRGNGLQRKMFDIHFAALKAAGYRHTLCTVSPKNLPSIRNMFDCGMTVRALKIKFGWMLRYILHKDIQDSSLPRPKEIRRIPASDTESQRDLLRRGFYGFALDQASGEAAVLFGK